MTARRFRLLAFACCGVPLACRGGPSAPPVDRAPVESAWFEDIAERAGVTFVHHSGHRDKFYLPEIMGGGAALFDMDNDGFLDLYLVQSGNVFASGAKQPGNRRTRVSPGRAERVRYSAWVKVVSLGRSKMYSSRAGSRLPDLLRWVCWEPASGLREDGALVNPTIPC